MLAVTLLLPVMGAVALHRAVHRRWSLWPLSSCLIAYNVVFLLGFMNFLLGARCRAVDGGGMDRIATAAVAARHGGAVGRRGRGVLLPRGIAVVLGVIVVCTQAEFLLARWRRREDILRAVMHDGAECAAAFAIPAYLYLASSFGTAGGIVQYQPLTVKLLELVSPVLSYDLPLDALTAVVILSVVTLSLRRGRSTVLPVRVAIAIAVLLLMFIVAPYGAKGGAWLDLRFPIMAAFLLFAGLAPPALPRMLGICAGLAIGILFTVRTARVAEVWHAHNAYVDVVRGSW